MSTQLGRVFNVMEYGAVGDGVADDSTEIQAAIDAIEALANPVPLFFPVGEYLCTTGLVFDDGLIRIIGGGGQGRAEDPLQGATLIAGTNAMELLRINSTTSLEQEGPIIEHMNFRDESAAKTATLLRIHNINRWTLRNCTLRDASGTGGIGLELTRETAGDNAWGMVDQCTFVNNESGLVATRSFGFNLVGGHFTSAAGTVQHLHIDENSSAIQIQGTKFDNDIGILIEGSHNSVIGATFENCNPGIRFNDTGSGLNGKRNQIVGCGFTGSGSETGIDFTGTLPRDNQVLGSTFTNLATNVAYGGLNNNITGHTRIGAGLVSSATTLDWNHDIVNVDNVTTITLPDCATFSGKSYLIRRNGASQTTIDRAGADIFSDGDTQKTLDSNGAAIGIFSTGGTNWRIVGTEGTVGGS